MRWLAPVAFVALLALVGGCAELGVVSDGSSISVGKPSGGYLVEGVRLPDRGDGFVTRDVWRARDNRYGTDELVDLITAVAHRMRAQVRDVKLVVADLSGKGGGERIAFHRSHQSGRDVDLLYYMRDASGQAFEPDAMHVFNRFARATDGSGIAIDVPRTWALVKELITAPEAAVQWIFMYEPIAQRLIEHAEKIGEPPALIARARKACRQPGDSARHDDHMHVRVYCSAADRAYGCVDIGPMELLAEREAEPSPMTALVSAMMSGARVRPDANATADATVDAAEAAGAATASPTAALRDLARGPSRTDRFRSAAQQRTESPCGEGPPCGGINTVGATTALGADAAATAEVSTPAASPGSAMLAPQQLGRMLRTRTDRIYLRSWR